MTAPPIGDEEEIADMTEAERIYTETTGEKPDSLTAIAIGLVWAIEQAPTLLDRVKAAKAALISERNACAKVAEHDTSFMMLQDFGMQQTCTQVRTNIADAIRARG